MEYFLVLANFLVVSPSLCSLLASAVHARHEQWQCPGLIANGFCDTQLNDNVFLRLLSIPMSMPIVFSAPYQCQFQCQCPMLWLNVNAECQYQNQKKDASIQFTCLFEARFHKNGKLLTLVLTLALTLSQNMGH